jgi:hypothetical protein
MLLWILHWSMNVINLYLFTNLLPQGLSKDPMLSSVGLLYFYRVHMPLYAPLELTIILLLCFNNLFLRSNMLPSSNFVSYRKYRGGFSNLRRSLIVLSLMLVLKIE